MQSAKGAPVFMNEHPVVSLPSLGIIRDTKKDILLCFQLFYFAKYKTLTFFSMSVACYFLALHQSVKTEEEKPFNPKGPQGKTS